MCPDMKSMMSSQCLSIVHHLFYEVISPKFNEKALKHLMDKMYIYFEKTFVHFEFVSIRYLRLYDEITNNEIKLANIQSKDNVLVIGSGSIPATAELIVRKTGAHVSCIDRDYQAVILGNQYAKQHHIDENLHTIHTDGSTFDYTPYDVIIMSYGVQGEHQLFSRIIKQMKPSARILYRQPYNPPYSFNSLPDVVSNSFVLQDRMISQSLGSVCSLILVKKNTTTQKEKKLD